MRRALLLVPSNIRTRINDVSDIRISSLDFYFILIASLVVLAIYSIPAIFSMDLWVFKDRGSFLNLDALFLGGHKIGVDTYYAYGLLPVLVQRILFWLFGTGFQPILVFNFVGLTVMALLWTSIAVRMCDKRYFAAGFGLLAPVIFWINPNLPYVIVLISMLGALALVLKGRLDKALAAAAVGCLSVPSMSLVLAGAIGLAILFDWLGQKDRRLSHLMRQFLPGLITYVVLALLLSAIFGFRSVLSTALPLNGMQHYAAVGYGGSSLWNFLFPPEAGLIYFVFWPPLWWILSTIALIAFGAIALYQHLFIKRDDHMLFVIICALVHVVFFTFAYGPVGQHIIFDPILCAGVLGGVFFIVPQNYRKLAFLAFVGLGFIGQIGSLKNTYKIWRNQEVGIETAGLYADHEWTKEWSDILAKSHKEKIFLLSYSTGVNHYFPTLDGPKLWTLNVGQVYQNEKVQLLKDISSADLVVADITSPTNYFDRDPDLRHCLDGLALESQTTNFKIWRLPNDQLQRARVCSVTSE